MANYWIYSHEALPNPEMMGKPRYTPDSSYVRYGGVSLPAIPKQEWFRLDEDDRRYTTIRRRDWRDRQGEEIQIPLRRFMPVVKNQFSERGVVMLDHEPTAAEKASIEKACAEENLRFRKKQIEFFEARRDEAKARQGQYDPSPYIDECYDILNMDKPYSIEALMEQRAPGDRAAERIAAAIANGQKDNARAIAEAFADVLTKPKEPQMPAARR